MMLIVKTFMKTDICFLRNVNLKIFLLIQTKNLEKKNLEIFGGHLAIFLRG
jgi:hypothetical protein